MWCSNCGEDSGMYYQPDPNTDYTNPNNESYSSSNESEDENEIKEKTKVEKGSIMGKQEDPGNPGIPTTKTYDLADVRTPRFVQNWHPFFEATLNDTFQKLSMNNLFELVYDDLAENLPQIDLGDRDEYIAKRVHDMSRFGYQSVSIIIQNFDNIPYNIRL
jgi:hypothetical protein